MSAPVRDLAELLRTLAPDRADGAYRFEPWPADAPLPADLIAFVREPEGGSVVRPADPGVPDAMSWITLRVHSALDAVGLTAAVAEALAEAGVPCNVVAGLRHDHLFVPLPLADAALAALEALSRSAGNADVPDVLTDGR